MKKIRTIILIIGLLLTLIAIEVGPYSSSMLSKYTNGYGTFDMKSYDYTIVMDVLSTMSPEAPRIAIGYYLGDFIFILFFGAIQLTISKALYGKSAKSGILFASLFALSIFAPILRGVVDIVENILLMRTYLTYPNIHPTSITIATYATQCKLLMIRVWSITTVLGLLFHLFSFIRTRLKKTTN